MTASAPISSSISVLVDKETESIHKLFSRDNVLPETEPELGDLLRSSVRSNGTTLPASSVTQLS